MIASSGTIDAKLLIFASGMAKIRRKASSLLSLGFRPMFYLAEKIEAIVIESTSHTSGTVASILVSVNFSGRKEVIPIRDFASHRVVKS